MIGQIFDVIGLICIFLGVFFMLIGAVGIWRFPDFYTRLHAAGVSDGMGLSLILTGAICYAGLTQVSVKLAILALLALVASPTVTHALSTAAYRRDAAAAKSENS